MVNLDIRSDDEGRMVFATQLLPILRQYLHQRTSTRTIESAAQAVLMLLVKENPRSDNVCGFGSYIIEVAEQIPYDHPAQHKLIDLIEALGRFPVFVSSYRLRVSENRQE